MKKLISLLLTICFFVLLTSCKSDSDWQKAEHTYSQLGFSVSYKYPKGCNSISSDDDPNMCKEKIAIRFRVGIETEANM